MTPEAGSPGSAKSVGAEHLKVQRPKKREGHSQLPSILPSMNDDRRPEPGRQPQERLDDWDDIVQSIMNEHSIVNEYPPVNEHHGSLYEDSQFPTVYPNLDFDLSVPTLPSQPDLGESPTSDDGTLDFNYFPSPSEGSTAGASSASPNAVPQDIAARVEELERRLLAMNKTVLRLDSYIYKLLPWTLGINDALSSLAHKVSKEQGEE
ncbi:MAG: hypothetical protein M1814_000486 [Vezdaea aestivalis]|nr:MAG: hypothetical protein M1814_000486 [Vezdaea aestivalis]